MNQNWEIAIFTVACAIVVAVIGQIVMTAWFGGRMAERIETCQKDIRETEIDQKYSVDRLHGRINTVEDKFDMLQKDISGLQGEHKQRTAIIPHCL